MTTLVLWRHAATPYNASKRLQGNLDIALDDDGFAQARRAAAALHRRYGTPTSIVASPLARAASTAQALADISGTAVTADARITQRSYGEWEGLTWDEIERDYPEQYGRRMRNEDPDIAGWGKAVDVAARVASVLDDLADAGGTHVLVSHGSSLSLGLAYALGLPLETRALARIRHARWVELGRLPAGRWQLRRFNVGVD